jgi:hypothetical protein
MRHVAAPEPSLVGRQGVELQGTWQRQSPPRQGGHVQGHVTCGSARAHLSREARFGAIGHMVVSEPILVGRWGLEL